MWFRTLLIVIWSLRILIDIIRACADPEMTPASAVAVVLASALVNGLFIAGLLHYWKV